MTGPTLDRHLDELGAGLEQGRKRADRRRRQLIASSCIVVATLTVGLGALVALPGGRQLDPVAQARAALGTAGDLLHYEVLFQSEPPEGSTLPPPDPNAIGTAVWTATTGPDRYRAKTPADGRPMYCGAHISMSKLSKRLTGPALIAPTEFAADARTRTTYSPFSRGLVISEQPAPKPVAAQGRLGGGFGMVDPLPGGGADPRDPVRSIRSALASGGLRDAGATRGKDGRDLRRLVGELPLGTRDTKPTQLAYFVDAKTFVPVELRSRRWAVWSRAGGRDHWKWITNVTRFKQFERLPDTPANAKLLKINAPADTTVIRIDARGRVTSPTPLPNRFSPLGPASRPANRACEAVRRPPPPG